MNSRAETQFEVLPWKAGADWEPKQDEHVAGFECREREESYDSAKKAC